MLGVFHSRCVLSLLYTLVETMRVRPEEETESDKNLRDSFRAELGERIVVSLASWRGSVSLALAGFLDLREEFWKYGHCI